MDLLFFRFCSNISCRKFFIYIYKAPVTILINAFQNHSDGRDKNRTWPISTFALVFPKLKKKSQNTLLRRSTGWDLASFQSLRGGSRYGLSVICVCQFSQQRPGRTLQSNCAQLLKVARSFSSSPNHFWYDQDPHHLLKQSERRSWMENLCPSRVQAREANHN